MTQTASTSKPTPAWMAGLAYIAGALFGTVAFLMGPALGFAAVYAGASVGLQLIGHAPLPFTTGPLALPIALFAGLAGLAGYWASEAQRRSDLAGLKLRHDQLHAIVAGDRRLFEPRVNKLIERAAQRGRWNEKAKP